LQMLHQRSQNALLKTYADTALAGITSKRWHNLCRRLICLSQRILGAGKYTISCSDKENKRMRIDIIARNHEGCLLLTMRGSFQIIHNGSCYF
jgi:hypothetical protein